MNKHELLNSLSVLEESFNPNNIEHLYGLLYLIYCNYEILNNSDTNFSMRLLALIDKCQLSNIFVEEKCYCQNDKPRSVAFPW